MISQNTELLDKIVDNVRAKALEEQSSNRPSFYNMSQTAYFQSLQSQSSLLKQPKSSIKKLRFTPQESLTSNNAENTYNMTFMQWKQRKSPENFQYFKFEPQSSTRKTEPAIFGGELADRLTSSFISYDSTSKIFTQPTGSFKEFQQQEQKQSHKPALKVNTINSNYKNAYQDKDQNIDRQSYFQWKKKMGIETTT